MSMTTATRCTLPSECRQRSANLGSSCGGRLSTTKKLRSSKTRMAWDLPAPERPVMIRKRTPSPGRFPPRRRSRAWRSREFAASAAGRRPLRPEDVAEDGADDRNEQRSYERRPEPGNGQRRHGGNQIEHQRVYDQGEQPQAEDGHRQGEQQDDRGGEGVHAPQDEGINHGVREHGFGDLQSLNDQRRNVHGDGGEHPAEDESCDHAAGSSGMINQQSRYANTPGKTPGKEVGSGPPTRRRGGARREGA